MDETRQSLRLLDVVRNICRDSEIPLLMETHSSVVVSSGRVQKNFGVFWCVLILWQLRAGVERFCFSQLILILWPFRRTIMAVIVLVHGIAQELSARGTPPLCIWEHVDSTGCRAGSRLKTL